MAFYSLLPRSTGATTAGYAASISIPQVIASILYIRHVTIALTIIITLTIFLRLYVRHKTPDLSDLFMGLTFLFTLLHNALSIYNTFITYNIWSGALDLVDKFKLVLQLSAISYTLALITLKLSLCFFLLNIFTHHRPQRLTIHTIMAITVLTGTVYLAVGTFTCAQVKVLPGFATTCPSAIQTAATTTFVIFSLVTILGDFTLTALAIAALWVAQLPLPTKISACVVLALGSVGGVASTVRLAVVLEPTDFARYTQQSFSLLLWVLIEMAVGICAANLAMAKVLLHKVLVGLKLLSTQRTTVEGAVPTVGGSGRRGTEVKLGSMVGPKERTGLEMEEGKGGVEVSHAVMVRVDGERDEELRGLEGRDWR
ncbi:hypothetical protein BDZ85DRAFT_283445 [Elsinoe ampelina]|uniref:Rhodopsin domain-containing protein n=1 Tax=Elsinoe ampelina TaxID=302913 RepID=A0A6A6G6Q2_9PEZI|nr:hypothetical protein BDZ85DRAFT_283445 [Elsinoe ampelina]